MPWPVTQAGLPPAAAQSLLALAAFVAIVVGGELFTTGTEWVAERFDLDESTTGSVFSALATTLPETLIPVLAIVEGSGASIGVGAILGGPVTLTAFAPLLLGAAIVLLAARDGRDRRLHVDVAQSSLDLRVFLVGFALAVAVGLVDVPFTGPAVGVGLVALYAWYLSRVVGGEAAGDVDTEPLEFGRVADRLGVVGPADDATDDRPNTPDSPPDASGNPPNRTATRSVPTALDPPTWLVVAQVVVALALLVAGADLFVDAVRWLAETVLGAPEAIVALLLAPLVSNVPENVDGAIWIRAGEDHLAVEQLTGTLAFNGTVIVALGVVFTPWQFAFGGVDALLLAAAAVALLTGAVLYWRVRRSEGTLRPAVLGGLGVGYLLFVGLAVAATLRGVA